jgi:hypothetical protein
MTPSDTTIVYKVNSFLHWHSDFWYSSLGSTCTCLYLNVGTNASQCASSSKSNFRFVGSPTVLHWERHNSSIRSAKACLISFQIDLVSSQYHVGKTSKPSRYSVAVSVGGYTVIMGLLFILGTLVQVGAHPKDLENPPRKPLDVLLLGHHLRRPARTSNPSRRPSPI